MRFKILGILFLVLFVATPVLAGRNTYTKKNYTYQVKYCTEFDITSDGSGNIDTSSDSISMLGYLWLRVIPDQTGNDDPYDGNAQPTDNAVFNVVNAYGVTIASITLDNATEYNDIVVGTANSYPIYIQELDANGKPTTDTIYFTGSGFGASKKIKVFACYQIK